MTGQGAYNSDARISFEFKTIWLKLLESEAVVPYFIANNDPADHLFEILQTLATAEHQKIKLQVKEIEDDRRRLRAKIKDIQ